jgi:hypothetical protein
MEDPGKVSRDASLRARTLPAVGALILIFVVVASASAQPAAEIVGSLTRQAESEETGVEGTDSSGRDDEAPWFPGRSP